MITETWMKTQVFGACPITNANCNVGTKIINISISRQHSFTHYVEHNSYECECMTRLHDEKSVKPKNNKISTYSIA